MKNRLFPTPDSIPFDVEEVHEAIEHYRGYRSTRISNGYSPRLIKELKRCGWGIDSDGYIYPLEKLQSKFNLLVDRRLKRSLAVASLVGTFSSIVALIAKGPILLVLFSFFILSFVTFYCLTYLDDC